MKQHYALLCRKGIVFIVFLCTAQLLLAQSFPAGFQATRIAQNLNPTDMKFSPDGHYLFVTDKSGKLFLSHHDSWNATPILDFSSKVDFFNERGFGHIAIDPDFATNGYIYAYYTVKDSGFNRVARFTFNHATQTVDPATHTVLLDLDPVVGSIHNGGAMNFAADGKLFVTTGETGFTAGAQDLNFLHGKILRMNKDGSAPGDNPFYNALPGKGKYIYALGLRNPFTADIQPGSGRYFVCDVGQALFEEVNEITAGKNYGWGLIEGPKPPAVSPPANYADPYYYYPHDSGCAIIGGVFYNPAVNGFPTEYQGKFFYGDYCNTSIKVFDPATATWFQTFGTSIGRPVAFAVSPEGAFYYLDRGGIPYNGSEEDNSSSDEGVLWKVTYTGSLAPTIAVHPDTLIVSVGSDPTFGIVANGLQLTYQWQRNGTDIPGATASVLTLDNVQLVDSGALLRCVVTNPHGSVTSDEGMLRVTNRPPPVPVITMPADGFTYVANTMLNFSGSATDPVDGTILPEKLTWKVDFHHDTHNHPVVPVTSGIASGSFFISPVHELSHNVWYRIYLTAENSLGIKTTIYREIYPQKVMLHFEARPGILINVDGTNIEAPDSILSVKGMTRSLTAPATFTIADTLFEFTQWGNGNTNPQLTFTTPNADSTINAVYIKKAVWNGTGLKGEYFNLAHTENFNGTPVLTRTDAAINFNWAAGSPDPVVRDNEFSVRWTGFVQPRTSGTYTFYLTSNDGVRLYVNNQLVIDHWSTPFFELQGTIVLEAGTQYPIRLEYFDDLADAFVELQWSGPDVLKQFIPANSMFIAASGPLPVNFVQFNVRPNGDALLLQWKIEDLGNVKEYTVERRKTGGGSYEAIATLAHTNGNTNYMYTDRGVNKNIVYEYRIKQTDHDGRYVYSTARTAMLSNKTGFDFVIVPNPAEMQKRVQLVFTVEIEEATVQLISAGGQVRLNRTVKAVAGQLLDISLEGLAKGLYYVKLINKDRVITKKLLIQ